VCVWCNCISTAPASWPFALSIGRLRGACLTHISPAVQELGIPTANLDSASLHGQLAEAVTGIYAGTCGGSPSEQLMPAPCVVAFGEAGLQCGTPAQMWLCHRSTGWASVGSSAAVYPQVMSIGFNPHYNNKVRCVLCR
jgi:FAD synthase